MLELKCRAVDDLAEVWELDITYECAVYRLVMLSDGKRAVNPTQMLPLLYLSVTDSLLLVSSS